MRIRSTYTKFNNYGPWEPILQAEPTKKNMKNHHLQKKAKSTELKTRAFERIDPHPSVKQQNHWSEAAKLGFGRKLFQT
jgi:hypothetical protein